MLGEEEDLRGQTKSKRMGGTKVTQSFSQMSREMRNC